MKEIILINSHTDNINKVDNLRNLIKSIKKENYEICLITHVNVPSDIIERCDYYIYDKSNPISTEPEIQYWVYFNNDQYEIKWVSKNAKIHYLAYYRLIFGGLKYLKTFNYDIVHSFDYDIVFNDFYEVRNNTELLKTYDIIQYVNEQNNKLTYFSLNLNSVDFEKMNYDQKRLFEEYKNLYDLERWPLIENLLSEYLPKNILLKNINELKKYCDVNTERANYGISENYDIGLIPDEDHLNIFILNENLLDLDVDILINNDTIKNYNIRTPYTYMSLDRIENINNIKVFINSKLYFKYELTKENIEYLKKWTRIRKK